MLLKKHFIFTFFFIVVHHGNVLADHPSIGFGGEGAGAINTISAKTPPAGSWGIGIRSEIIDSKEYSTEELETFAETGLEGIHSNDYIINTSLSLSHGLTQNFGITAVASYIQRKNIRESEIEDGEPEAHTHGDSSGMGDLLILGQYRLLGNSDFDLSILAGTKAPVGETHVTDNDSQRFETEHQPGTGAWDFLIGIALMKNINKVGVHANFLYNKTTEGSQFTEIGEASSLNVALTYRLNNNISEHPDDGHDHVHENQDAISWDLSLDLNGEIRGKNSISGISDENSGGTIVNLSPGIRVTSGVLSGFVSYGIPIIVDQNGLQSDLSSRIVFGGSFSW